MNRFSFKNGRSSNNANSSGKSKNGETRRGRSAGSAGDKSQQKEEIAINEDEFAKSCQKIHDCITAKQPIDLQEGVATIFLLLCKHNISEFDERISAVEEKVEEHEEIVSKMQKQIINLEIEQYKTKFVMKNVPLYEGAENEIEDQEGSKNIISELLQITGQSPSEVDEVFRFPPQKVSKKSKQKKSGPPNLFVKFSNSLAVNTFFKRIQEIKKNDKFKDIAIDKMIPPSLLKDFLRASEIAYNLRKNEQLMTKVEIQRCEIILLSKTKGPGQHFCITPYKNLV